MGKEEVKSFNTKTVHELRPLCCKGLVITWKENVGPARGPVLGRKAALEKFCGQAGHFTAFTGREGDVPKTGLVGKRLNEHCEGVVRFAHVGRVDLARVAGEDHLRTLADASEDCFQCRGLKVLCFVDNHNLSM